MMRYCWAICILISVVYASIIPKGSVERIKWLADNNFQSFSDMLSLLGSDLTEEEAARILSIDNFEPLFNLFEGNSLNNNEVEQIFYLANKHLVTGDRMNEILDIYFKYAIESRVPSPDLIVFGHIHSTLEDYLIIKQLGIKTNENEVELDGWEVNEENKQLSLQLFKALAFFSTSVSIKNLPIDDFAFDQIQIQIALHSNIKSISFENCQILNTNKYFQLNQLNSFKFSDSYCKNFIEMLRTISRDSLIQLDISNNAFTKQEISNLTILFEEFKQLKSLNVSFNFPYAWRRPNFTGEIIKLTNLKSLNVSGNLDFESFATELNKFSELINLEELNLSNNLIGMKEELFVRNLVKFTALKRLDLTCLKFENISILSTNIFKLKSLQELSTDKYICNNHIEEFIQQNQKREFPLKIKNCRMNGNISLSQICTLKNVYFSDEIFKKLLIESLPDQFTNLRLIVDLWSFRSISSFQVLVDFFSRFNQLKFLEIELGNSVCFNMVKLLLDNNPIEELRIWFSPEFVQFKELISLISNRKVKSLKLQRWGKTGNKKIEQLQKEFFSELKGAELWKEVEIFKCRSFSLQSVILLLTENNNCKRLRHIKLKFLYSDGQNISNSIALSSVRRVKINIDEGDERFYAYNLSQLIQLFPQVTELKFQCYNLATYYQLDFSLLKNLQSLDICCQKLQIPTEFIDQLKKLAFLTRLLLIENFTSSSQFTRGKHENFASLVFVGLKTTNQQLKNQFTLQSNNLK